MSTRTASTSLPPFFSCVFRPVFAEALPLHLPCLLPPLLDLSRFGSLFLSLPFRCPFFTLSLFLSPLYQSLSLPLSLFPSRSFSLLRFLLVPSISSSTSFLPWTLHASSVTEPRWTSSRRVLDMFQFLSLSLSLCLSQEKERYKRARSQFTR